jgi:hypothetical protein
MNADEHIGKPHDEKHIELSKEQKRCRRFLKRFVRSDHSAALVLGPGGTGKSTTVTYTLSRLYNDEDVIFAAFTNKAAQNLRRMIVACGSRFETTTIHKLLRLESKTIEKEGKLTVAFNYKRDSIRYLEKYQVIVIDELSMISTDLQKYLNDVSMHLPSLKIIYMGDYYQLPPVNETSAEIFRQSVSLAYPVHYLTKVMRAKNEVLADIFRNLYEMCHNVHKDLHSFIQTYPKCVIPETSSFSKLMNIYIQAVAANQDAIWLTHSNKRMQAINVLVQNTINDEKKLPQIDEDADPEFHVGDRFMLDRPANVCECKHLGQYKNTPWYEYRTPTDVTLYNGEVYKIAEIRNIHVTSFLSRLEYFKDPMPAQLIMVEVEGVKHHIVYIKKASQQNILRRLKQSEKYLRYLDMATEFMGTFSIFNYGYATTIYKAQGSDYDRVFIDMRNIYWCLRETPYATFQASYTALTRAKKDVYAFF